MVAISLHRPGSSEGPAHTDCGARFRVADRAIHRADSAHRVRDNLAPRGISAEGDWNFAGAEHIKHHEPSGAPCGGVAAAGRRKFKGSRVDRLLAVSLYKEDLGSIGSESVASIKIHTLQACRRQTLYEDLRESLEKIVTPGGIMFAPGSQTLSIKADGSHSTARTSNVQWHGGTSHDQPTMSSASKVWRTTGPRWGAWI
jgi:hypothetical protein